MIICTKGQCLALLKRMRLEAYFGRYGKGILVFTIFFLNHC